MRVDVFKSIAEKPIIIPLKKLYEPSGSYTGLETAFTHIHSFLSW